MQFRRATYSDKDRILEICSTIWEGHDYIPNVIDTWLDDTQGEFTMIIEDNQIVGMAKMSLVEEGVGWLEGLRVAPEARSRGYAKEITRYYIQRGQELGFDYLRLSTYYENGASIHVTEGFGFKRVAEFFICDLEINPTLPTLKGEVCQAQLETTEGRRVLEMLLDSPETKIVDNYLGYGWLFIKMTKAHLEKEMERGHIFYVKEGTEITGAMLIYPDHRKDNVYYIILQTGSIESKISLLHWAHQDGEQRQFTHLSTLVPENQELKEFYLNHGFIHWEEGLTDANVYIYEFRLKEGEGDET